VYRVLFYQKGKKSIEEKDFKIEIKSRIDKDRWLVQLKIPLKQFANDSFKYKWHFNAFRSRNLKGKNVKQASGLRLLGSSYHNLNNYNYLIWPKGIEGEKSFLSKLKFWQ
jgi:hypothetical protein